MTAGRHLFTQHHRCVGDPLRRWFPGALLFHQPLSASIRLSPSAKINFCHSALPRIRWPFANRTHTKYPVAVDPENFPTTASCPSHKQDSSSPAGRNPVDVALNLARTTSFDALVCWCLQQHSTRPLPQQLHGYLRQIVVVRAGNGSGYSVQPFILRVQPASDSAAEPFFC